ncbi:hypothetical protein GGI21_002166 [Coemansia aciculifera]|nr:hypothetical protein GGI21_002166 [Coemansia aciculifera]
MASTAMFSSLRGRAFLLLCGLSVLAMVGIVGTYNYYPDHVSTSMTRIRFESYIQNVHYTIHDEEVRAYCSRGNFSRSFVDSAEQRYSGIRANIAEPIFVAANVYNSEAVLPNMVTQLLALADKLGHDRVFVSIYENGSKDKTKEILRLFNATLDELGIGHSIIAENTTKPAHLHRIEYLAQLRNKALEPLHTTGLKFSQVVFLNDVYFCLSDILELVFQSHSQDAHLTCAEDYDFFNGGPGFYDTWVARDIRGEKFKKEMHKISDDDITMVAQMRDRPFQVQCCWNGIAVIDSKVFAGDQGLRFRRSAKGECSASECSLMCNDMWHKGFNRMVMVPRVKLTYDLKVRNLLRQPLYFPGNAPFSDPEVEKISFRPGPKKVLCNPLNGVDSHHPDGPAEYVNL